MQKNFNTTVIKQGNMTVTTTVKSMAASMPCVGKVQGVDGRYLIVWLEAGIKGLRTGSILALKHFNNTSDIFQICEVVMVREHKHNNNKFKVAYVEYQGALFGTFKTISANKGIIAYGNVFLYGIAFICVL